MSKLQDQKESNHTNSPSSPLVYKSKIALQIENTVSLLAIQKCGEILERCADHITLLMRPQMQKEENTIYYYVLNFKQKYYSVVCSHRLDNYQNIIKKKGYCNFLFAINDWNADNDNGKVMIWCADQKIIKIKTCNILFTEGENISSNLLFHLSKLQNDMKNFIIKITPKTIKLLTMPYKNWQKYKTGEQIKNLICIKNIISNHINLNLNNLQKFDTLNSNLQNENASLKNTNQDMNRFMKLEQDLYQNINIYQHNLQNIPYIVGGIKVEKQLTMQEQCLDKNCEKIRKFYCQYELFSQNSSINNNAHIYMKNYPGNKNKVTFPEQSNQKQVKYQAKGFLVQKRSNIQDTQTFQNEVRMLLYLRLFKCQGIANYYLQSFNKQTDIQRILIKLYSKNISLNLSLHNKLKIVFKIAMAINFMYNKCVLHRDLKFANILLDNKLQPKLIDFDSSCFVNSYDTQQQIDRAVKLRTTRFYNKFYQQCNMDVMDKITKKQYETHPLFDLYAFGKIIYMLFDDEQTKRNLGCLGYELISFLIKICIEQNPNLRVIPSWILLYLAQMQEITKPYLFFQKIERKTITIQYLKNK